MTAQSVPWLFSHPWLHWVFESAAYTIGFWIYSREKRASGDFLAASDRLSVVAAAIVGAALGSKILSWFETPVETLAHWNNLQYLMQGKTIVGGLLGGTIAVEITKRMIGVTRRTGDLFAVPICVGTAVGRIGCFFAGLPDQTYGVATALPWGIDFGDGVRRHPTQLYEVSFVLGLAWVLAKMRPVREGDRFRAFLVAYLAFRLAIEFWKPGVAVFGGLTAIQWACVAALVWYAKDLPYLVRLPGREGDGRLANGDRGPFPNGRDSIQELDNGG
ncbi:MAG: prolipoprotein diacylglyceryl transferase family protein [Bryobacteraceae bacterium]